MRSDLTDPSCNPLHLGLAFLERWRVYEASVYMAWGDGRLDPAEVTAARAIVHELDLELEGLSPGSLLRVGPPVLADIGLGRLDERGRHLAYATAAWVALCDQREHPAERAILTTLAHRMGLDPGTAFLLETSARLVCAHASTEPRAQYRALLQAVADLFPPSSAPPGGSQRAA